MMLVICQFLSKPIPQTVLLEKKDSIEALFILSKFHTLQLWKCPVIYHAHSMYKAVICSLFLPLPVGEKSTENKFKLCIFWKVVTASTHILLNKSVICICFFLNLPCSHVMLPSNPCLITDKAESCIWLPYGDDCDIQNLLLLVKHIHAVGIFFSFMLHFFTSEK